MNSTKLQVKKITKNIFFLNTYFNTQLTAARCSRCASGSFGRTHKTHEGTRKQIHGHSKGQHRGIVRSRKHTGKIWNFRRTNVQHLAI